MGKMKDVLIDKMNEQTPDDTDWNYQPIQTQADGKKLYIIKEYKIWAYSYEQALELLPLIESF